MIAEQVPHITVSISAFHAVIAVVMIVIVSCFSCIQHAEDLRNSFWKTRNERDAERSCKFALVGFGGLFGLVFLMFACWLFKATSN